MQKQILTIWITGLLLGACSVRESRVEQSASTEGRQALQQHPDARLVSAHPHLMKRKGAVLEARGQTFADEGDCQSGDCTRYRADGVWKGEYVGIDVSYYEEGDYFLVGRNDHIPIGSRPISSRSGTRFFTGHHDDRRWSQYQGASVCAWDPHPRRLRIVDTDLVAFYSFIGWHGDSCVEFTGARGFNVALETIRTFWLAERDGDWQLFEDRPAVCK